MSSWQLPIPNNSLSSQVRYYKRVSFGERGERGVRKWGGRERVFKPFNFPNGPMMFISIDGQ